MYIGMNAIKMMAGALTPASSAPPLATIRPRLAASEYAGAVEAIPTTMLDSSPRAPPLRPLLSTVPAGGSTVSSPLLMAQ